MRTIKQNLIIVYSLMLLLNSCGVGLTATEKESLIIDIENAVETPNFVFKAIHANPAGYKSIYLPSTYEVRIADSTLHVYLPFYGRTYRLPIEESSGGGYKFTSTDFEYSVKTENAKAKWEVLIAINDLNRPMSFRFDIWNNGRARLDVTDSDRQHISFQGTIQKPE